MQLSSFLSHHILCLIGSEFAGRGPTVHCHWGPLSGDCHLRLSHLPSGSLSQIRVPKWLAKVFGGMGQGHQENEGFINLRQWLRADSFYAFSSLYRISVYSMFRRPHAISHWPPVSKA